MTISEDNVLRSSINITLFTFLLLFSCKEEAKVRPEHIMEEEEFVEVLVDMNLIEAIRSINVTKEKDSKVPTEAFYNQLWTEKGITEEEFLQSFEYYREDPEKMSELYREAADILKRKEDDVNALKQEKRKKTPDPNPQSTKKGVK